MPGLVIAGKVVHNPAVQVVHYLDDPKVRLKIGEDGKRRATSWVRHITLHTTQGIPGGKDGRPFIVRPGLGVVGAAAENNVRYWSRASAAAGAHIVTDFDATHVQTCDLVSEFSWHAGLLSPLGVGWEIVQGDVDAPSAEYPRGYAFVYAGQLTFGVVPMADELTRRLSIQRQLHAPWRRGRPVARLVAGGADAVGLHGHNDATTNRGQGDPGGVDPRTGDMDHVRKALRAAGYEAFDFEAKEDLRVWSGRQRELNRLLGLSLTVDGVPGPATCDAIRLAYARKLPGFQHEGAKHGLWVYRQGDEVPV